MALQSRFADELFHVEQRVASRGAARANFLWSNVIISEPALPWPISGPGRVVDLGQGVSSRRSVKSTRQATATLEGIMRHRFCVAYARTSYMEVELEAENAGQAAAIFESAAKTNT